MPPDISDDDTRLDLLLRLAESLDPAGDLQDMLDLITLNARVQIGANVCCALFKQAEESVVRSRSPAARRAIPGAGASSDGSQIAKCGTVPEGVACPAGAALPRLQGSRVPQQCCPLRPGVLAAPIVAADGSVSGILCLAGKQGGAAFSQRDEHVLLQLARMAANAVAIGRAAAAAERSRRQWQEFLGLLGHELRNQLAPLRTGAHLLRRIDSSNERIGAIGGLLERRTDQLAVLVNDLIEAARSGKSSLQRSVRPLSEMVRHGVETVQSTVERKRQRLTVDLPAQPICVDADFAKMCQVINNLMTNASKFTQDGGEITVAVRAAADRVTISVRDNGRGIPPDLLERVFDRFAQVQPSSEGLGLGLWVSKKIVDLHGGRLVAASEGPDKGTEMLLSLPLVPASAADGEPPAAKWFGEDDGAGAERGCRADSDSGKRQTPLCCDE